MKSLKNLFGDNMLLKVTSFNSIGILVKIVTGFVTQKALAIFVGPSGVGVVGNFRDFFAAVQTISTAGLSNGIIKYVAEFKKDSKKLAQMLSTSLGIMLIVSSLCAVFVFFTASYWNEKIFSNAYDFTFIIKILALAVPLYALDVLLLAVINGYSRYKTYVVVNAVSNVTVLLLTLFLLWQFRLEGALYSLLAAPVLVFLITVIFVYNKRHKARLFRFSGFRFDVMKKFGTYTLMALLSGLAAPVVRIAIRDYIEITDGKDEVGYWEAMHRISNYYLMFFTSLMTLYVLPKLSEIKTNREFRTEIGNFYKTILPLFAVALFVLYLLRNYIILILQTSHFLPMESLFAWQLTGDFFKVASMVIAYQFLAKNMFWHFVVTEIFSLLLMYFSCIWFISSYGYVGASIGYALQMAVYLLVVVLVFRKKLFGNEPV